MRLSCICFLIIIFELTFSVRNCNAGGISVWDVGEAITKNIQIPTLNNKSNINNDSLETLYNLAIQLGVPPEHAKQSDVNSLVRIIKIKIYKLIKEQEEQEKEIKRIANKVGISNKQINSLEINNLLTEIIIQLDDYEKFNNDLLTKEDLRILSICLNDDLKILEKVIKYHNFVERIHDYKLIKLPTYQLKQE